MEKKNSKKVKKLGRMIPICLLLVILLTISTYAWFIGMKTVEVSPFDIDIASTDSLYLSMDGKTWTSKLNVGEAPQYEGNTNSWAPKGLSPVSTIGNMDTTTSRLIMYSKGSLSATRGGYKLLTGQIDNSESEQPEYVAFDLFVKNLSGRAYYTENNVLNEEAIYLNTNSAVKISTNGGVAGTGIENSVRVAFTEIGRVIATTGDDGTDTSISNITSMTCQDVAAGTNQTQVTGICRTTAIWEPNDGVHVQNAINWYDTSCRTRTGLDTTDSSSYNKDEHCITVATTDSKPTYAISRILNVDDYVDTYDGVYNGYTKNTSTYAEYIAATAGKTGADLVAAQKKFKLIDYPYFTDTDKAKAGNERPEFMTLAPNSITKLRVYIYIEGQDIDNYDFASLGKKISVNFGFTKEKFTEGDIDYDGPYTGTVTCPTGQMPEGKNCVTECSEGKTQKTDSEGNNYCE